jgi:uncharacterized protein (DUF2336 family)
MTVSSKEGRAAGGTPEYGPEKKLARDGRTEVRQELATRQDIAPEILYFLAEDDDPAVRRAVATNPATPRQADLLLTTDPDGDVRLDLARKIGRLAPGLSRSEQTQLQALTLEALRALAIDSLPRVRQAIAEEIKATDTVPPDVVNRLARDVEEIVAAPVLEFSPLLSDADMLEIIESAPIQGVLSAISRRQGLAAPVCDAIADTDNVPAIAQLLTNPSAQIREETLDELIKRAPRHREWHRPLATRPRLSEGAVTRICQLVSRSLLNSLQESNELPAEFTEAVAARVETRLDDQTSDDPDGAEDEEAKTREELEKEVRAFHEVGRLDDEKIRERMDRNDRKFVYLALSCLTDIDYEVIRHILGSNSAIAVIALCRRAGLSMRTAIDAQSKIATVPGGSIIYAKDGIDYPHTDAELEQRLKMYLT